MKQDLIYKQKLNQTLHLSMSMKNSLDILKMNQSDLLSCINEIVENNPVIDYTPSIDMHQYLNESISLKSTLQEELYLQLHTCNKPYDEKVANYIIESLDEHGFLSFSHQQYIETLKISKQKFVETLSLIQTFEPLGVGALSSIDAMCIQLQSQSLFDARDILIHYQDELLNQDYSLIAKKMNLSLTEVKDYIEDIRQCDPFPCRQFQQENTKFIIPDFDIEVKDGEIEIVARQVGHIQIEDELALLKKESGKLKAYFNEAYYFIDALTKRNKTLLMMADALIHIQKNHFLYQDELKPCTLLDIASRCGFHESTVSRTLSNKFYRFENEVYPVKELFVSSTKEGSSKDSILKMIKKFVEEEDKENPLADFELVQKLSEVELYVSRRAISKYRALLHIPNSKERRKKDSIFK